MKTRNTRTRKKEGGTMKEDRGWGNKAGDRKNHKMGKGR